MKHANTRSAEATARSRCRNELSFNVQSSLMVNDYKVVKAFDTDNLELEVKRLISQGYHPIGGVSVAGVVSQGLPITMFVQAMVK